MNPTRRNTRTWTDEQLRAAVASERSWRAVARALTLKSTSTNTVRRHAARLGLDTSHFTGQRRWTDLQLREAVAASSSWSEVLVRLNVNDDGESRTSVKGHATRLGLDASHLQPPPRRRLPSDLASARADPRMLRSASQSIVTAWFALRGFPVAVPSEPEEYDLLVTMADGIQRVQVKTTTQRSPNGRWAVGIGHRPYSLDKTASRTSYDPDSLDYFCVLTGAGAIYVIPSQVLAGRVGVLVDSYREYLVGQVSELLTWDTAPAA